MSSQSRSARSDPARSVPSPSAYLRSWKLVQTLDAIGFNLDGWTVAIAGDDSLESSAIVRLRHPFARPFGMSPDDDAGIEADLILHLDPRDPLDAATAADRLLPRCRWLCLTLPDAPGTWEALDHLPVAHRFVFPEIDRVAARWAGQEDVARNLRFGFLLRGQREPGDLPLRPARDLLLPPEREPALRDSGTRLLFVSDRSWAQMLAGEYWDPEFIKVLHPKPASRCDQGCDAHFEPGRDSFETACKLLPPGWEPDAVLVVTPEYTGVPDGMETCPWPTIALVSDWNVNLRDLAPCLGAFDLVLGDSGGMQRLRALGFSRVHYWPMYSYDAALHRPTDGPKTHELAFIGNLNHRVQRQRTRWLRHVAGMAGDCKVQIATGVFGPDYAKVLQASRMVFNRSIRGELNLRCYEAPACGALLLVEATNAEARTLLRDGEDCAYYDESTLDEIVARYLSDPEALARVASSGTQRVLASSYTAHFSALLGLLRDLGAAPPVPRPFAALPEVERLLRLGRLAYRRTEAGRLPFALTMLTRARSLAPGSIAVLADLAVVYASIADECEAHQGQHAGLEAGQNDGYDARRSDAATAATIATELFDTVLKAVPDHPVVGLNAAWFFRRRDPERARNLLLRVAEADEGSCQGLLYPMTFRHLEVEMETAWHSLVGRPAEQETEMRRLLTWQAARWLGDMAWGLPEWSGGKDGSTAPPAEPDVETAIHWYQVACGLRPDLAETQTMLGLALLHKGEFEGAVSRFRAALEDHALSVTAMKGLIRALAGLGKVSQATAFYDQCLAILPAIPQLLDRLDDLRETYWSAIGAARGERPTDDTDRLKLDGLRDRNYLLFAEGEGAAWLSGLEAYLRQVPASESACLVVYSADRPPDDVLGEVQRFLEASGFAPDAIPDVVVVDRPLSERQEHDLVTLVQGVFEVLSPARRKLVATIGRPLLGTFA